MAGKDNNTYENIHSRLSEAIEDAYLNDLLQDVKEPDIDLSFLSEGKKQNKNYKRLLRISAVAVIVIVALLGTNIVLLSADNMDAYGDKGVLHRLYEGINGIFTDEDETEDNDLRDSFEISNEKGIDKAKKYFAGLYVPKYIPEGYSLNNLTIEKYNSGDTVCVYNYSTAGDSTIDILCLYNNDTDFDYETYNEGEVIDLGDRIMYITWNDVFEEYTMTVYFEDAVIDICIPGSNNKEELIMIGKQLKK